MMPGGAQAGSGMVRVYLKVAIGMWLPPAKPMVDGALMGTSQVRWRVLCDWVRVEDVTQMTLREDMLVPTLEHRAQENFGRVGQIRKMVEISKKGIAPRNLACIIA